METIVHTFLVPSAAGAWFASASTDADPRRTILWALLRGAASEPSPLTRLAELAGLPDRKAAGSLVFKMQREGWLGSEEEPFRFDDGPLDETLATLLPALSTEGCAVLADAAGLTIASTGFPPDVVRRLSAHGAGLLPYIAHLEKDAPLNNAPATLALLDSHSGIRIAVRPLCFGRHRFHLTLAGAPAANGEAVVRLVALLGRRYLGQH